MKLCGVWRMSGTGLLVAELPMAEFPVAEFTNAELHFYSLLQNLVGLPFSIGRLVAEGWGRTVFLVTVRTILCCREISRGASWIRTWFVPGRLYAIGTEYTWLVLKRRRSGNEWYNIDLNQYREVETRLCCLWVCCAVGAHHLIGIRITLRAIEEGLVMASTILTEGVMEKLELKFWCNARRSRQQQYCDDGSKFYLSLSFRREALEDTKKEPRKQRNKIGHGKVASTILTEGVMEKL